MVRFPVSPQRTVAGFPNRDSITVLEASAFECGPVTSGLTFERKNMDKRDWELINECVKMLESTLRGTMPSDVADNVVSNIVAILRAIIKTSTAK